MSSGWGYIHNRTAFCQGTERRTLAVFKRSAADSHIREVTSSILVTAKMFLAENYEMLPRNARSAVDRMLRARGIAEPTAEDKAEEAYWLRVRSGWFVWECPSTARPCRERKRRIAIPEYDIPAMPDL